MLSTTTILRVVSISAFCIGIALIATGAAISMVPLIIGGFAVVGCNAFVLFASSLRR